MVSMPINWLSVISSSVVRAPLPSSAGLTSMLMPSHTFSALQDHASGAVLSQAAR
jgi:hypothetical protein